MRGEARLERAGVVAGATIVLLLAPAGWGRPADAHPYGPPPEATLATAADEVVLRWEVASDDAFSLGEHLGLVAEGSGRRQVAGILTPEEQDRIAETLAGEEAVVEYVRERVAVRQDGVRCDLASLEADDIVRDGATFRFACPARPRTFELELTLLHDVHESYRTFVTAEGRAVPERAVFTVDDATQRWQMAGAGGGGLSGLATSGLAGAAVIALVGLAVGLRLVRSAGRQAASAPASEEMLGGDR